MRTGREDFEDALYQCKEIINAMDVLIKPEILDTIIKMIETYQLNHSRDIDDLEERVRELQSELELYKADDKI